MSSNMNRLRKTREAVFKSWLGLTEKQKLAIEKKICKMKLKKTNKTLRLKIDQLIVEIYYTKMIIMIMLKSEIKL